jgi:hypothetical protein
MRFAVTSRTFLRGSEVSSSSPAFDSDKGAESGDGPMSKRLALRADSCFLCSAGFGAAFDQASAFAPLGPQGPCETGSPWGSWWMLDEMSSAAISINRAFGRFGIFTEASGWEDVDF